MKQVTKDMTIQQVLSLDEGVAPVFYSFGMHCLGCPMSRGETVEEAAAAHGVDADEMVGKLNEFISANA